MQILPSGSRNVANEDMSRLQGHVKATITAQ